MLRRLGLGFRGRRVWFRVQGNWAYGVGFSSGLGAGCGLGFQVLEIQVWGSI